jgi:hypothetical protein
MIGLTGHQVLTIRKLADAGCVSLETSLPAFDALRDLNPGTVGRLQSKGLAAAKVRGSRGGSRLTHYWLTEAGVAKARELAD